jgi:hypothetical protein
MDQAKAQTRPVPVAVLVAVVVLTLFTAGCHLYLGVRGLARPSIFTALFLLNGLSYLTLLAALMLPIPQLSSYRHWLRWGLLGFAALTVVVWVTLVLTIHFGAIPLAYVTKVVELTLIGVLWFGGGGFNRSVA